MKPLSPSHAFDVPPPAGLLAPDQARLLLRKLRDLDLHAPRLSVSGGRRVRVDGCLSLDSPVESSLRYLVHIDGESDHVIEIGWHDGLLDVEAREWGTEISLRRLRLPLFGDASGRATVPDIRARAHPDSTEIREFEHFMRRLVRAAFTRETRN